MYLLGYILLQGFDPKFKFLEDVPRNQIRNQTRNQEEELPTGREKRVLEAKGGDMRGQCCEA